MFSEAQEKNEAFYLEHRYISPMKTFNNKTECPFDRLRAKSEKQEPFTSLCFTSLLALSSPMGQSHSRSSNEKPKF